MRKSLVSMLIFSVICCDFSGSALASSDEAWSEFFKDVKTSCKERLSSYGNNVRLVGDVIDTNTQGVALGSVDGKSYICFYDKTSREVENVQEVIGVKFSPVKGATKKVVN